MLKNPLDNEPVALAGAVRAVLYALVLLGAIALNVEQLAAIAIALELVLTMIVRSAANSNVTVAKVAAEAYEAGREAA